MKDGPEAESRAPESAWQVRPGPFGHGNCIAKANDGGTTDIIAPPGVPLMSGPNLIHDLMQWRWAQFSEGEVSEPALISLEEATVLAEEHAPWIVEQQLMEEIRDNMGRLGEFSE